MSRPLSSSAKCSISSCRFSHCGFIPTLTRDRSGYYLCAVWMSRVDALGRIGLAELWDNCSKCVCNAPSRSNRAFRS